MSTITAATLAPDVVELRQFPRPDVGPTGMLIEVLSAGICGSDKHMYLGHAKLQFPVVAGHEMVGRVEKLGEGISTDSLGGPLEEGDRVTYCYFFPWLTSNGTELTTSANL